MSSSTILLISMIFSIVCSEIFYRDPEAFQHVSDKFEDSKNFRSQHNSKSNMNTGSLASNIARKITWLKRNQNHNYFPKLNPAANIIRSKAPMKGEQGNKVSSSLLELTINTMGRVVQFFQRQSHEANIDSLLCLRMAIGEIYYCPMSGK